MEKKVSIIMPIYNSEQYLEKSIESIINQSYKNLEIILINDGSTDKSEKICESYSKKDSRIIYKSKENEGPGPARNVGLSIMSGDYISFVDSDDYIDPSMIEKMVDLLESNSCEVVQVGARIVDLFGNTIEDTNNVQRPSIISGNYDISFEFARKVLINNYLCNKLFKNNCFNNIRIPSYLAAEDHYTLMRIFLETNKVFLSEETLYNYVSTPDSLSRSDFNYNKLDNIKSGIQMYEYMNKVYSDLATFYAMFIASYSAMFYTQIPKSNKKIRKKLSITFDKYYKLGNKK